jgi:hypothetical protein
MGLAPALELGLSWIEIEEAVIADLQPLVFTLALPVRPWWERPTCNGSPGLPTWGLQR